MSAVGWVVISLAVAVALLALVVAYMACQNADLRAEVEDQHDANHAKCIAHIADFTSKRIIALNLREYARRWESVEEKANLNQLARGYKVSGPSMPAIWLNQQADLLDPPSTPLDLLLAGGRDTSGDHT